MAVARLLGFQILGQAGKGSSDPLTYPSFSSLSFPGWPGTCYGERVGLELTEIPLPLLELRGMKYNTWPRRSKLLAKRACPGLELLGFLVLADTSILDPLHLLISRPGHPMGMMLILGSWLLPSFICPGSYVLGVGVEFLGRMEGRS